MKKRIPILLCICFCFALICSLLAGCHIHTYGKWQTTRSAECFITQEDTRTCSKCGDKQTRNFPALGHSYKDGACTVCGRPDWDVTDITNPHLYSSDFGFRTLASDEHGEGMQALYTLIDEDAIEYHDGQSTSSTIGRYNYGELGITYEEALSVWKLYMDDHPLYYWLSRSALAFDGTFTVYVDNKYTDPYIRSLLNQTIYETANRWRKDTSEIAYLAALSYHDTIINKIDYLPSNAFYPEGTLWAHNIIGVFTKDYAVCEGYARTFQLLLNLTGIENIFVTGKSGWQSHAWNLVKLDDGNWYWFDLTYDDVPRWMWGVQYNYFAVNDTQNLNWSDDNDPVFSPKPVTFLDEHTPDNGVGVEHPIPLPVRAESEYAGVGELMLRKTFTVGDYTYAHVGHKAVQLVKCTLTGDVYVPSSVGYDGTNYEVISVGGIQDNGLLTDSSGEYKYVKNEDGSKSGYYKDYTVFEDKLNILHFPETIRFLWSNALSKVVTEYSVSEDNLYYTAVDGVLFTKSLKTIIRYPSGSKRKEYVIPDETEDIANGAFAGGGGSNISFDPDTHEMIVTPLYEWHLEKLTIGSGVSGAYGLANWGSGWLEPKGDGIKVINVIAVYQFDHLVERGMIIIISPSNPYLHFEDGMVRVIR